MMFLSFLLPESSTDLDDFLTSDVVLAGLYLLFPTTYFFLIYSPKDISSYLLPYDPIIFFV